jgi:hypothetical protein
MSQYIDRVSQVSRNNAAERELRRIPIKYLRDK